LAKTVIEKLTDAITAGVSLRDNAVVGDQPGEYSKEYVDSLTATIELTKGVAGNENAEQKQQETALSEIGTAIKFFKGSVIKPAEKTPETPNAVSLKGVVLRGTESEKKGNHTIFAYGRTVTFRDGRADVSEELASKLIADGYAKEGKPEAGE
jgi:hypothetical protein